MRIAYICPDLGIPVFGNKGASVHVRELTNALVDLGHTTQIICAMGGSDNTEQVNIPKAAVTVLPPSMEVKEAALWMAESLLRLGLSRNPMHVRSEMRHVLADEEFVRNAIPVLREFRPELIIARHSLFSIAGPVLAQSLNIPCVLEVNAPLREERRRFWGLTLDEVAEQGERKAFAESTAIVAVSEGLRMYLQRCGADMNHVTVIPNGVDLLQFHQGIDGGPVRQQLGPGSATVIGFVGSLKPWHGLDQLVRACASLIQMQHQQQDKANDIRLLIVGDGPEREFIQQLCHDLGIGEHVIFTGAVPHAATPMYLAAMDIAVAPYALSNGFYFSPLKIMEYMAMGLAVVAPQLGQIPYLLQSNDQECGIVYDPDSVPALTRALYQLMMHKDVRLNLGNAGAQRASEYFSWQTVAERMVKAAFS